MKRRSAAKRAAKEVEFGADLGADFINPAGDTFDIELDSEVADTRAGDSLAKKESFDTEVDGNHSTKQQPKSRSKARLIIEVPPTKKQSLDFVQSSSVDSNQPFLGGPALVDTNYKNEGTAGHGSFRKARNIDMVPQAQYDPDAGDPDALTDDELSDLAFAFQACDSDEDGWITVDELQAMICALGGNITKDDVQELVAEAKQHFKDWLQAHLQQGENFPDYMLYNGVEPGHHGDTKHGGQRHFHLPNVGNSVQTLAKDFKLGTEFATKTLGASGKLVGSGALASGKMVGNVALATASQGRDGAKMLTNSVDKMAGVATSPLPSALKTGIKSGANLGKRQGLKGKRQSLKVGENVVKLGGAVASNAPVINRAYKYGLNLAVSGIEEADATSDDKLVLMSSTLGGQDVESELRAAMADTNKLIYAEYVLMITGDLWTKYVKTDWHKLAWKMRLLRNCYDTADVEGKNELTQETLEMVIFALDPDHGLTHDDIVYLWNVLNPDGKPVLTFDDYLHGMGNVAKDEKCHDWIDIARPNQWELLSLIIDTPHSEAEDQRLLSGLSWLEREGVLLLKTMKTKMDLDHMRDVLSKVGKGQLRHLEPEQRRRMRVVHLECVLACAMTGFVFSALPALVENYLLARVETDGLVDAYWVCTNVSSGGTGSDVGLIQDGHDVVAEYATDCRIEPVDKIACPPGIKGLDVSFGDATDICDSCGGCLACSCPSNVDQLVEFWVLNTASIFVWVIFEVLLLMYFCARFCVKVGWALDFRLVPLNVDRVFVADALVRAAFELGNPDSVIMGVDPHAESSATGHFRSLLALVLYKAKVTVQSGIHKLILVSTTHPSFYMYAKPWLGTCLATVMWDALVSHTIMNQAEMRGFGVYTSVELFNEVMELHYPDVKLIPEAAKIQIVRAIGVAIVKMGSMYPTLELLLRHAVQYLGLRGKQIVSDTGTLDSEEHFLIEMAGLDDECKTVVLSIHLLSHMLTGSLNRAEKACWHHVVDAAGPEVACQYSSTHMERLSFLCWRFRHYEVITADDLHMCFAPESDEDVPPHHYFTECCFRFTECLTY